MSFLVGALAALALGPALVGVLGRRRGVMPFLDGFVVLAIPGLIFLHVLPEAAETGAFLPVVALLLGFAAPILSERVFHDRRGRADRIALLFGVSGLALHAALDGAALPGLTLSQGGALGLAVVLHRFPVGLAVWWLVSSRLGRGQAAGALALLMAVTVAGFAGGAELAALVSSEWVEVYQAFVGGSLIHVVFHRSNLKAPAPVGGWDGHAEGIGAVTALAILVGLILVPSAGEHSAGTEFFHRLTVLSAESAPALLLAYVFAGLLHSFLPNTSIRWMSRGNALSSAARGVVVGLPLPICSCGVVPLYETLVRRGAPPAAAMAFLVATPELGLDAIFLSIPLLGPQMTVVRLVVAGGAALFVGWWVGGRMIRQNALPLAAEDDLQDRSLWLRLRAAMGTGLGEVVDHTAPWIVVGLGLAALAAPLLESGWLGELPPVADVFLFALLGFPTYVCASSATPLVATLLATGLSPGAAVAFLITGPATNATTLGVLSSLHGRRPALIFAGALVGFAVSAGVVLNLTLGALDVPTLAELTEEVPGILQQVSLVLLVALFLASIVRRGIRRFVGELSDGLGAGHRHDHEHDHHHDHDHGHHHPHTHREGPGDRHGDGGRHGEAPGPAPLSSEGSCGSGCCEPPFEGLEPPRPAAVEGEREG